MRDIGLFPFREKVGHSSVKGGEFSVAEDGGFDVANRDLELRVAGPIGIFEQRGAYRGEDLPVALEAINVAVRYAAAQVGVNVLQVLQFTAVNVAREIGVEVVVRIDDFVQRHHARIPVNFQLPGKGIHNLVDVLCPPTALLHD